MSIPMSPHIMQLSMLPSSSGDMFVCVVTLPCTVVIGAGGGAALFRSCNCLAADPPSALSMVFSVKFHPHSALHLLVARNALVPQMGQVFMATMRPLGAM